jgi:UDP-N-acetylmuramyl-tripeptide synthetase
LFAALVGQDGDGHDFAAEAVGRGATAVLAERLLPVRVPTCVVADSRDAFGRVCQALAGDPGQQLRVIGLSGTYGKTTVGFLLAAILEQARHGVGYFSSFGSCNGRQVAPPRESTPTSPELARWLAATGEHGCGYAILEASSEGLSSQRYAGIPLDVAVMTNVRRAHLDRHGSLLNYRAVKGRLFSLLKPMGVAVVNADDPASQSYLGQLKHPVITIGIRNPAEVTARALELFAGEQTILLTAGGVSVPVRTQMIGQHHVYNCLSAAATALVLGVDLATIAAGLEAISSIPGRMERVDLGQPFATYVDVARSPDALASVLSTLRRVTEGRLLCVYGAPARMMPGDRPLLGRVVERVADVGVITRNGPGDEEPLQIAHEVLDGYDRPALAHLIPDRAKAIGWVIGQARPKDVILIAGRGDEMQENVGGRWIDFDDRQVARYFLTKLGYGACATRKTA